MPTNYLKRFQVCEICGATAWRIEYVGKVRDGAAGSYSGDAVVASCGACGVSRLDEGHCKPDAFYETDAYRKLLQRGLESRQYFTDHDELQPHTLRIAWPFNLRGATIADIGCGGGSLLDALAGLTDRQIAVEPYGEYRTDLERRGYETYRYAVEAAADWAGRVDIAFSIQVIEHTKNPRQFLEEIAPLLSENGKLIISTPNLNDILMRVLPDEFPSFFYRTVHRWYFNAESLATCARSAGFEVDSIHHVHRFGLSNALAWARDRRPTGNMRINGIDALIDSGWKSYLESTGQADWVFLILKPKR